MKVTTLVFSGSPVSVHAQETLEQVYQLVVGEGKWVSLTGLAGDPMIVDSEIVMGMVVGDVDPPF